jgi:hypothetical protein
MSIPLHPRMTSAVVRALVETDATLAEWRNAKAGILSARVMRHIGLIVPDASLRFASAGKRVSDFGSWKAAQRRHFQVPVDCGNKGPIYPKGR